MTLCRKLQLWLFCLLQWIRSVFYQPINYLRMCSFTLKTSNQIILFLLLDAFYMFFVSVENPNINSSQGYNTLVTSQSLSDQLSVMLHLFVFTVIHFVLFFFFLQISKLNETCFTKWVWIYDNHGKITVSGKIIVSNWK